MILFRSIPSRIRRICAVGVVSMTALASLGVSAVARADEPTPLEVFRRHFDDRSATIRRKAVLHLRHVAGPEVADALVQALADEDARVVRAAREQLLRRERGEGEVERLSRALDRQRDARIRVDLVRALAAAGEPGVPALLSALDDSDPEVQARAARELGQVGTESVLAELHDALGDADDGVRAEALHAIGRLRGAEAVGTAAALLRGDRGDRPRVAAAGILEMYPSGVGLEHLSIVIADRSWSVRLACARALGRYLAPLHVARDAAGGLVRALERESRERVREEIATALFRLTGIDFGPDAERWRAWWAEAGESFRPPERPLRRASVVPGGTRAGLLHLPTGSDHVTFVLDGSHSMNDPVRFGSETTKKEQLVEAFERAMNRLPDRAWANLIPFGTEPAPYKRALFRATPPARRAAVRYLEKRIPDGRTNIYDALELAFRDAQVDTIVLVTDGAPSEGARTTRTGILEGLGELNRFRVVRVHTVEIGAASTSARWRGFLRQIAESTGGHYLAR